MENYNNTIISFGSLKDALLHFEYLIPMNFVGETMGFRPVGTGLIHQFKEPEMQDYRDLIAAFGESEAEAQVYPPHLANNGKFRAAMRVFDGFLLAYMVRAVYGEKKFRDYLENLAKVTNAQGPINADQYPTIEGLQQFFEKIVRDFHLYGMPIDCSLFTIEGTQNMPLKNSLSVSQVRIIDTEKISFPQIMEFRKDKETMKKMRRWRLFAYQEYKDKNKAFIEDDIQKRYDDYCEAVRASGFQTTVKTLSFLLESKLLAGALATSAASLLLGNVQLAVEAFSAGAVIELGKLSLAYAKQRHALAEICRENPISYIVDVKKKLELSGDS